MYSDGEARDRLLEANLKRENGMHGCDDGDEEGEAGLKEELILYFGVQDAMEESLGP